MTDDKKDDGFKIEDAPNYEADMAKDAEGIAAFLAKQIGMPVRVVNVETGESGEALPRLPKPTLESLRERARAVAETLVTCVTGLLADRKKLREESATRALVDYVHTGNAATLRKFVTSQPGYEVHLQLEDRELADLIAVRYQDNTATATALGMYTGALLTRNGFTLQEVMDCACDPVFAINTLALKSTPAQVTKRALEVTSDAAQADIDRRRRAAD